MLSIEILGYPFDHKGNPIGTEVKRLCVLPRTPYILPRIGEEVVFYNEYAKRNTLGKVSNIRHDLVGNIIRILVENIQ